MKIIVQTPTKAEVIGTEEDYLNLSKFLSYTNTSAQFVYTKHLKNRWWKQSNPDTWRAKEAELREGVKVNLLMREGGKRFVRPGSIPYLLNEFPGIRVEYSENILKMYKKPKPFPWYSKPKYDLYPYQKESVQKLLGEKHGNVSIATGGGKSLIILTIARELGLKVVVATPGVSIFSEMLERFEKHLGKSSVGAIGDGKKRFGKLFTVAISKSLSNLKPGTKEYKEMSEADVLIVDESHLWGADTLSDICHGLFANTPYRFFFSGTQTRGDGGEKLLQSIIGKTVLELKTEDAIRDGFICPHTFNIVPLLSSNPGFKSDDPLVMKRKHFLYNDNIAQFVAKLANSAANIKGEQTLVLVDEVDQISRLVPLLTVPYVCATGESKSDFGDTDPVTSVEKFNKGQAKVLIGTSCITTGTNIYPTHHTINWQGGSSEIKTKQGAVGRSVRKLEGSGYEQFHKPKPSATIWDFDIIGNEVMKRHLNERISYYKDSGTEIKVLKWQK
jgi:superfamily II DNA or RNA helicase